jgi:dTDP-4-dehydrorhamnose 3,5-epimerase
MIEAIQDVLDGVKLVTLKEFRDGRGRFVKSFHDTLLREAGIAFELKEEFYSTSHKNVLRGMHFQAPPHDHTKLVMCLSGEVIDVVLDLRKSSAFFGKSAGFRLSSTKAQFLYIPKGFAHGFLSLADHSMLIYKTDAVYTPEFDRGILWNTFGFSWQIEYPILSTRDNNFPSFSNFLSPF